MKYYKSSKAKISYLLLLVFSITLISSLYVLRGPVYRSIVTINLGSLKVDYMNSKANFLSSIRGANLETVSVNMSPNNFVKMNMKWLWTGDAISKEEVERAIKEQKEGYRLQEDALLVTSKGTNNIEQEQLNNADK